MEIEFVSAVSPAGEAEVAATEQRLGTEFPADWRHFLTTVANGGRVEANGSTIDDGDLVGVTEFLGVGRDGHLDLEARLEVYGDRVPEGVIPIAENEGGNLICLMLTGLHPGSVWYWDHDWEAEEGETPTFANMTFLADSFDIFARSLLPRDRFDDPDSVETGTSEVNPEFLKRFPPDL